MSPNDDTKKETVQVARRRTDKIFDNSFNTGTAEIQTEHSLKVEDRYVSDFLGGNIDAYEEHRQKILMRDLYNTFAVSKYGEAFLRGVRRKIPKQYWTEIFMMLKASVKDESYNHSEIFTGIADFMGVSYRALYDNVPVVYKEQILGELDDSYAVMDSKGKGRLF